MWINITKDVFVNSDFKALNFLFQILSYYPSTATKPRYNIVIDVENVRGTTNFEKLEYIEPNLSSFLEEEYNAFVIASPTIYKNITSHSGASNFNIEEAIPFLNQPVSIILENNKNDSEFILAIIKYFGNIKNYNKAQEHIDHAWLQFENAGGCGNIPNFMEGFLNQFKHLAEKNNRKISDYFRGIILIDSDKEYSTQAVKGDHKALLKKLNDLNIDVSNIVDQNSGIILNKNPNFHILEKRMMENYLPKEVYQEIKRQIGRLANQKELNDWLDVYLTLSVKEQLDFLNIPDGFPPGEKSKKYINEVRKSVANEILSLFQLVITDINFQKLDNGFDFKGFDENGKLNTGKEFNVKNELPKWFKKGVVNRANLEKRDGIGELQSILDKITALL